MVPDQLFSNLKHVRIKLSKDKLKIKLRNGSIDDLAEMQELFVNTIKNTCKNDYSKEQIDVWTSSVENKERWKEKLKKQYLIIAEAENKIVGYGSLENGNYLAFMYVHQNYLRQGIANKLYIKLENETKRLGYTSIDSDVSLTAKPFFEKNGFKTIKENINLINGIEIINFRMRKELLESTVL